MMYPTHIFLLGRFETYLGNSWPINKLPMMYQTIPVYSLSERLSHLIGFGFRCIIMICVIH